MNNEKCGFRKDYDPKKKIVAQHYFYLDLQKYFISTVDLGINYSYIANYEIYYETMIFKLNNGEICYSEPIFCKRYRTRVEALENHNFILDNIECLYNFNGIEKIEIK